MNPDRSTLNASASRPLVLTGERLRAAERHLGKSDRVMAKLVRAHGQCKLARRPFLPFHALTTAIISQQLSVKAADTIAARVAQLTMRPFVASSVLAVPADSLRAAGLSSAKVRYIHGLARWVEDGALDFQKLRRQTDEGVLAALTAVPGIGRWTAEMFLIFSLKRPDILSLGDAGLSRAVRLLYGDAADIEKLAEPWRPYRSVASWYLWQHLDTA